MGVYSSFLNRQYPDAPKCKTTGIHPRQLEKNQKVWVQSHESDINWVVRYFAGDFNENGIMCWFGDQPPSYRGKTPWSLWSVVEPIQKQQIHEVWLT